MPTQGQLDTVIFPIIVDEGAALTKISQGKNKETVSKSWQKGILKTDCHNSHGAVERWTSMLPKMDLLDALNEYHMLEDILPLGG